MKTLDIYKEAYPSTTKSSEQLRVDALKKQKELVGDRLKQEKKRQKVKKAQQQLSKAVKMPTT
jgi:hypothetical protein|tara:strand:- start:4 stop:192 length:189 start_codon:yes stop_codon:yes gene_type:complete